MIKGLQIAIDGPAASGKSTTARLLAKRLDYIYIDTGAMYRAATKAVLDTRADPEEEQRTVQIVRDSDIGIARIDHEQHTFLNNKDVTLDLRTPAIDRAISAVSSYPAVRDIMVAKQRELAAEGGIVMDGRDIGSIVLPGADLKVFMVASLRTRAERRLVDLRANNIEASIEDVENDIRRRDTLDSSRGASPLFKADDARELDTTGLSINEQVQIVYGWARELLTKSHS